MNIIRVALVLNAFGNFLSSYAQDPAGWFGFPQTVSHKTSNLFSRALGGFINNQGYGQTRGSQPRVTSGWQNLGQCDESRWPDKHGQKDCGDCMVLAKGFNNRYATCEEYCKTVGLSCTGAWEDTDNTCRVLSTYDCRFNFHANLRTSDAICRCGQTGYGQHSQPRKTKENSGFQSVGQCNESRWPDKHGQKNCGECTVLAKGFDNRYSTCEEYCRTVGLSCTGAWEDKDNTCQVLSTHDCRFNFHANLRTSDAICQCGQMGYGQARGIRPRKIKDTSGLQRVGQCDESRWPDKHGQKDCGECKVLAKGFNNRYSTCDDYCRTVGMSCTGAWEDKDNTCRVLSTHDCKFNFHANLGTSDAICQCGMRGNFLPAGQRENTMPQQPRSRQSRVSSKKCKIGSGNLKGRLPGNVKESSGIDFSSLHRDTIYTHNDSGGRPKLYAISESGNLKSTITLSDVSRHDDDWEDIAVSNGKIYIANIGNNCKCRNNLKILRIDETTINGNVNIRRSRIAELRIKYENGRNFDSEAIVVDHATQTMYLFTKQGSRSRVYKYPGINTARDGSSFHLIFVTELRNVKMVTGAGLSPDGNTLVLNSYEKGYSFTKAPGDTWESHLKSNSPCHLNIIRCGGTEAVAVSNRGVWTSNECVECSKCGLRFFPWI